MKDQCFFWLFRRVPYRLGSLAITAGSFLFASYAADTLKWGVWKSAALAGASVLIIGYLYDLIWIARCAPRWPDSSNYMRQKSKQQLNQAAPGNGTMALLFQIQHLRRAVPEHGRSATFAS